MQSGKRQTQKLNIEGFAGFPQAMPSCGFRADSGKKPASASAVLAIENPPPFERSSAFGRDGDSVRRGDGEAVFNVEKSVELRESQNMKVGELSKAQQLAEQNRQLILAWLIESIGPFTRMATSS